MNKPVYIEWDNAALIGVAGKSGTGKTNTLRWLLTQAVMAQQTVLVLDGHGQAGDQTLAQTAKLLGVDTAYDDADVLQAIADLRRIADSRIDGNKGTQKILVIIDELINVIDRSSEPSVIVDILQRIADQYRKADIRCVIAAQNWGKDFIGSASIRRSMSHIILHRMAPDEVGYFTNSRVAKLRVPQLSTGHAVAATPNGVARLNIPLLPYDNIKEYLPKMPKQTPFHLLTN